MYMSFLHELKKQVQELHPKKVLVLGFGNGPELTLLSQWLPNAHIVAVDKDERAILGFRHKRKDESSQRIVLLNADLRNQSVLCELKDTDLVVALFVLHLIDNSVQVSSMWHRLSSPQTVIAVADWCTPNPCTLDERWSITFEDRFKFNIPNPQNTQTTGAVLRFARKK